VVRFCVERNIHPDLISYLSLVAAGLAALLFLFAPSHPMLLLVVPAPLYLRLWFDMLDGMVALAAGKASRRGEILNDLPDRISDVLIFAGVAHSGLMHPAIGYWAAIAAVLTAYVGTFGQAVGAGRQFAGMMSKPWRMVFLHAGAWLAWGLIILTGEPGALLRLSILDWTCLLIVAGCLQTIAVRLRGILNTLDAGDRGPAPDPTCSGGPIPPGSPYLY
jgi:phosphatidylglycerophosphate synthase